VFLKNATYWFYWKKSQKSVTGEKHFFQIPVTGEESENFNSSPVPF